MVTEPWWLEALAQHDLTVVGEKQWFSHNYQLTGIEAYMDMCDRPLPFRCFHESIISDQEYYRCEDIISFLHSLAIL